MDKSFVIEDSSDESESESVRLGGMGTAVDIPEVEGCEDAIRKEDLGVGKLSPALSRGALSETGASLNIIKE